MAYHDHNLSQGLPLHHFTDQSNSFSPDPTAKPSSDPHHQHTLQTAPNWLNNALLRTHYADTNNNNNANNDTNTNVNGANGNNASNFLNLHTAQDSAAGHASQSSGQWLARPILHRNHSEVIDDVGGGDSIIAGGAALSHESADFKAAAAAQSLGGKSEVVVGGGDGGGGGMVNWQIGRCKAEILAHPLYEQLLSAHVSCLRIATPVDQLPRIDAQLAQSQNVVAKYSAFGHGAQNMLGDDKELDQFMGL